MIRDNRGLFNSMADRTIECREQTAELAVFTFLLYREKENEMQKNG